MKKLILLLTLSTSILFGCKKDSEDADNPKSYDIEVNVADGVSYTYKSTRNSGLTRQSNPNLPNASFKTTESIRASEAAFVLVTTNVSKEAYFEVTVKKSSNGSVVAYKKEKGEVLVTWGVKDN